MSLDPTGALRETGRTGNVQALNDLKDLKSLRSRLNPKDLVDLLLSHGARAWRASQPACRCRIRVAGLERKSAVRLSFGRKTKL